MERGSHWWNEPPLWAWIVMVVGAVALAVMLPFGLHRSAPADDAAAQRPEARSGSSASSSPTAGGTEVSPSPETAEAAEPTGDGDGPVIAVIGDGYASGTAQGGRGPDGWPALLEDRIEGADVDVAAAPGAGYVATGEGGLAFGDLAATVDLAGADVVVVLGSRDDGPGIADQVAEAGAALFAGIGEQAPDARLVVIGPIWPEETVPAGARNNRDVLRDAAEAAGAVFVDPLEEAWFVDRPELLGEDGTYPTDDGHAYLADLVEPAVAGALTG